MPKPRTDLKIFTLALSMLTACGVHDNAQSPAVQAGIDSLEQQFADPPNVARPRVWWHWLNGNISKDGIEKDLQWMQRSGIGGLHNFDVNFAVPSIVDEPIPYMSDEWKDLYRYSVSLADELGLEFTIAASPGWSETGGPWVEPEEGMKKLVWSETIVNGGQAFEGVLSQPPMTTGPFQDLGPPKELNPTPKPADPVYYADIAVLAYPVQEQPALSEPAVSLADGSVLQSGLLTDEQFSAGVEIPRPVAGTPTQILIDFDRPQTVRSATLFLPDQADIYAGPKFTAVLEVQRGSGEWASVAGFQLSTVPTTIAFDAVSGSRFRVSMSPVEGALNNSGASAPGFDSRYMDAIAAFLSGGKTIQLSELRLSAALRVHQFEAKSGFTVAPDYYSLQPGIDTEAGAGESVAADAVIDLTAQMAPNGTLAWTPPAGRWKVLRLGYSLLGKTNHPAVAEATGLEVDKMDPVAVRRYIETYLQNYRNAVGVDLIGERGIGAILTDSTEVGAFNWTPDMLQQFQRLRGYSALQWLPALTGEIVGSRKESDQFLYDYRRTIADLHAAAHYGTVAEVAHENGLKVYGESLEGWRPSLGDDLEMRRYTDFPMAALWSYNREEGARPLYFADMRGAASVAHLYGQNLAAAESMTSTRHPWDHVPADLRRVVDLEFIHGINRVVIHSSVHQPLDEKQPGLSLRHIGQFFNRHTAWSDLARPWIDYMARSSFMLQQGRFVADVAYFYGEEAPLGALVWDGYLDDVPAQYGYDFINPSALLNLIRVEQGRLVTDSGASYALLYLGGTSERMTLPVLRRISELVAAGATVVGDAPLESPALQDDPEEYRALVARLWSGGALTSLGKGRVITSRDVEQVLVELGIAPDVSIDAAQAGAEIPFVHRELEYGDVYFLSNRNNRVESVEARFRVSGKKPRIWRADTGQVVPVSYRMEGDLTVVPLSFEAEESYFVSFLEDTSAQSEVLATPSYTAVAELAGPWSVVFQEGRGAPAGTQLNRLMPLNESDVPGIKYFSGESTYSTSFSLGEDYSPGQPLLVDLGEVGDLAEVRVNGQQAGVLWHKPFRADISSLLVAGENRLEIRVANRWVNRLIGDAQPGAEKIAFTVTPTYAENATLRPAGLIGPVRLLTLDTE